MTTPAFQCARSDFAAVCRPEFQTGDEHADNREFARLAEVYDNGAFDALANQAIENEMDIGGDIFVFGRRNLVEAADWTRVPNEPAVSFDFANPPDQTIIGSSYRAWWDDVFAHSLNIDKPRLGKFRQSANNGDSGIGM
jgi:hypothetical protein